jgi:4-hydroxybenzoate polyprenyltransferase
MLSYLQLFRWNNLLVVALTQYLLRYAIILPLFYNHDITPGLTHSTFFLLVLATLMITAAGYAINDYFDLGTDRINRPSKIILGRSIPRRKAILYHSLLNLAGVLLGAYLSFLTRNWSLLFIFLVIPLLLWLYSVRYKRLFFIGNFIVAALVSFVITIVWIFEYQAISTVVPADHIAIQNISYITRVYALFAFLTTLTREIIKDVEDISGDSKIGCRTIPIVAGVGVTKNIIMASILITAIFVLYVQVFLLKSNFNVIFVYITLFVQLPMIYMIEKINHADERKEYSHLSMVAKIVMIAGVLSMGLFYFNFIIGRTVL